MATTSIQHHGESVPVLPSAVPAHWTRADDPEPIPTGLTPPHRDMVRLAARDYGWFCSYCSAPLAQPFAIISTAHGEQGWEVDLYGDEPTWNHRDGHRQATRDHVEASARGGTNDLDNLVLACRPCNTRKKTMGLLQFLAYEAELPTFRTVGTTTIADFLHPRRRVA